MEKSAYIPLSDLTIYQMAMELGGFVWSKVIQWDTFAKQTVGNQFVKAADSIAANISEGYGRYHLKEKCTFYYFSRGSLFETKTWAEKSKARLLLSDEDFDFLMGKLGELHKKLNQTIKALPIQ